MASEAAATISKFAPSLAATEVKAEEAVEEEAAEEVAVKEEAGPVFAGVSTSANRRAK